MIIDSGSVILRAIEKSDMNLLLEMMNDPGIERMTGANYFPVSSDRQLKWFENYDQQKDLRCMIDIKGGATIGSILLTNIDYRNQTAELHQKIKARPEDRKTNDVLDAMMGFIHYGFNELNMQCIYGTVLEYNLLSRRLASKCGLREEGILRNRLYKNGKYCNLIANSVIKEDFMPLYKEYKENLRNAK